MCEANVYLADDNEQNEKLILTAVDQINPEGPDTWRLTSIFGEQKMVQGRIRSMSLVDHRIVFEPTT